MSGEAQHITQPSTPLRVLKPNDVYKHTIRPSQAGANAANDTHLQTLHLQSLMTWFGDAMQPVALEEGYYARVIFGLVTCASTSVDINSVCLRHTR